MDLIIQALRDLWSPFEDVVGSDVLETILAVTLILFVYMLFFRLFLTLCKASKRVKFMCDLVILVICLMVVLGNLLPTFSVRHEFINSIPVSSS